MVFSLTLPLPLADADEKPRDGPRLRVHGIPRTLRFRRPLRSEHAREWVLEVEVEARVPDPEEVLAGSVDFLVDAADGSELGVVDALETDAEGAVSALIVARGWLRRDRARIPVADIDAIAPTSRRIVLRR